MASSLLNNVSPVAPSAIDFAEPGRGVVDSGICSELPRCQALASCRPIGLMANWWPKWFTSLAMIYPARLVLPLCQQFLISRDRDRRRT